MRLLYLLILFVAVSASFSTDADFSRTCQAGQFKLKGMQECHPFLTCSDLKEIQVGKRIGIGSTKVVHVASWNGLNVAVSQLINDKFSADFDHGLNMLQLYSSSSLVVQLVGFCKIKHIILTEHHELGNATSILPIIQKKFASQSIVARLKLCLNYAHILELLHEGPGGTRVMCDSNDLEKLLSQFLVTDDVKLILNDLDALPMVDKSAGMKIKCGTRELIGDFVAPEQKWPFRGPFKEAAMPGYDEKTDIWKAADIFKYFVSNIDSSYEWVHYRLFNLFKNCKNLDSNLRPTANYLVSVLEKILAEVSSIKTEL